MTAREIVAAAALEVNPADRAAYLNRVCGDDQNLLHGAQALLKSSPGPSSSGESPRPDGDDRLGLLRGDS